MTHTSGFPNFPTKGENKSSFFEGLKEIKIDTEIGSNYAYSNYAPEVMAYILEKVCDMPYEQLLAQFILDPIEMNNTKFDLAAKKKQNWCEATMIKMS